MSIQNKVEEMIKASTDKVEKNNLKFIKAELQRCATKEVPDEYAILVINALLRSQTDVLKYVKDEINAADVHAMILTLESLLPEKPVVVLVSEEEIVKWISENIDFTQFKSKMAAMKPIMAHFGDSADGNVVKALINDM